MSHKINYQSKKYAHFKCYGFISSKRKLINPNGCGHYDKIIFQSLGKSIFVIKFILALTDDKIYIKLRNYMNDNIFR